MGDDPAKTDVMTVGVGTLLPAAAERSSASTDGASLDTFWIGPENEALRVGIVYFLRWLEDPCLGVAQAEDSQLLPVPPTPLTLWGGPGMGKSHLAQGLSHWWRHHFPERTVVLRTAPDFGRSFHEAEQFEDLEHFRETYDTAGLVIIEDVHHLEQRESSQVELARVLQTRGDAGLPTVCTTLGPWNASAGYVPQLDSRLSAGIARALARPRHATRAAYITARAERLGQRIEDEAVEYLAAQEQISFFQLQGILQNVAPLLTADEPSVTLKVVRDYLMGDPHGHEIALAAIARATAKHCQVKVQEIRGKSRRSGIMRARSIAMYLARKLTTLSLEGIGEYFSGRDHTTVIHACKKVERLLAEEADLGAELEEIRLLIRSH